MEEPLHQWAERRDQRLRPVGSQRVVTLTAAHVDPRAPRVLQEWDGHNWTPVALTDEPPTNPTVTGSGRHRRS